LIRFKRSEFALARALADSVLAEAGDSVHADLRLLGGLAGLTGKLARATVFARISGAYLPASGPEIPTSISAPAAAFFTNAAFGICGPATDRIEQELDRDISSAFSEDDRERARAELKSRPISFLASCTNGLASLKIPNTTDKLLRMQQACELLPLADRIGNHVEKARKRAAALALAHDGRDDQLEVLRAARLGNRGDKVATSV
jgi:hypothetical protein